MKAERTVGVGFECDREVVGGGGWTKFEKGRRGRQYRGDGLHKIGRLAPLCCQSFNTLNTELC